MQTCCAYCLHDRCVGSRTDEQPGGGWHPEHEGLVGGCALARCLPAEFLPIPQGRQASAQGYRLPQS
ncbi:Uncharacterised protein [Bordetella pertussis]|nr:Uncharacterised protein [Bordetella pertussis]